MPSSSEEVAPAWNLDTPVIYGLNISWSAYVLVLRQVSVVNAIFSGVFSWIINVLLICAVLRKTNTIMGSFKFLMVAYAVMDILCSLVYVIACPITSTPTVGGVIVLVVLNGGFFFNMTIDTVFLGIYFALLTSTIVFSPILFIFRYLQICKAKLFAKLRNKHLWLFSIPVVVTTVYTTSLIFISLPNDYGYKEFEPIIRQYTLRETAFLSLSFLKPFPMLPIEKPVHVVTGAYAGLVAASLGVMLFCARGMVASLNKVKSLSERTYKMQHRLFRMLVAQFMCPLLMIHLPFCKSCIGVVAGWGWPLIDDLLPLLFAWAPVLNAAIALGHIVNVRSCCLGATVPSKNTSLTPLQI